MYDNKRNQMIFSYRFIWSSYIFLYLSYFPVNTLNSASLYEYTHCGQVLFELPGNEYTARVETLGQRNLTLLRVVPCPGKLSYGKITHQLFGKKRAKPPTVEDKISYTMPHVKISALFKV